MATSVPTRMRQCQRTPPVEEGRDRPYMGAFSNTSRTDVISLHIFYRPARVYGDVGFYDAYYDQEALPAHVRSHMQRFHGTP